MLTTLSVVAGLLALALLVILYWRMAQRVARLSGEVERLRVVQRDMATDVRGRLEEGARTWESVDRDLRPRLDLLEPGLADLSATIEEHLPTMGEARSRVARLEERVMEIEAELRETMGARTGEIDGRLEEAAEALRALRVATDERVAQMAARVVAVEHRQQEAEGAAARALEAPAEEDGLTAAEDDALAAVEAAAEAPGTFGAGRGTKGRGRTGRLWLVVALVAALGLLGAVAALS